MAFDILTGTKYEGLCPTSNNLDVPFAERTEYQLLSADDGTGKACPLAESGSSKGDLSLPTVAKTGEPTKGGTQAKVDSLRERGGDDA